MFQTVRFIQMMSLTFGLFTQVSGSGPLGPLVGIVLERKKTLSYNRKNRVYKDFGHLVILYHEKSFIVCGEYVLIHKI